MMKSEPFYPELADALGGANPAIILAKIHHWCKHNEKKNQLLVDGYFWTSSTLVEFQERDFFYIELKTVQRIIKKLSEQGFVVVGKGKEFRKFGRSNQCYRVDYDELRKKTGLEFDDIKRQNVPKKENDKSPAIGQNVISEKDKMSSSKGQNVISEKDKMSPSNKYINKNNINNNINSLAKLSNDFNSLYLFNKWCEESDIPDNFDGCSSSEIRILGYIKQFYTDEKDVSVRNEKGVTRTVSYKDLIERLQELKKEHIEYVAFKLDSDIDLSGVSSPRFYMLPIIYNAVKEIDDYYDKKVNQDFYNVIDDEEDYSLEWLENK